MPVASSVTYNELKSQILDGTILPGTVMVEREIAEKLGVSRVPVREAFQRLVYDGLLSNSHGKELVTRTYNEQEILDLYVYREALDGLATRLFTSRAEKMEIQYLKMVFDEMEDALDHYEHVYWQEKDIEFHQTIARGARNDRLFRSIDGLYKECFYLMRTYRVADMSHLDDIPEHISVVLEEHRGIVNAVVSGDPKEAEEAACHSVRQATERMIKSFISRNRRPRV
jgi:DNA-binding GntR family transcriptional regulator